MKDELVAILKTGIDRLNLIVVIPLAPHLEVLRFAVEKLRSEKLFA